MKTLRKKIIGSILGMTLLLGIMIASIICLPAKINVANAQKQNGTTKVLQTEYGKVVTKDKLNRIELVGKVSNVGQYVEDIKINVYDLDKKDNDYVLSFVPKVNSGYTPSFMVGNFEKKDTEQLYFGVNSGGSGGFGFYFLYELTGKPKLLFDSTTWDNKYQGKYIDGYKVEVTGANNKYRLDLSLRDKDYLNQLYDENGKLKKAQDVSVLPVGFAFAYFNTTQKVFQIQVWQRITGLYNADNLGYVINNLEFANGKFSPYFTVVGIESIRK